MSSTIRLLLVDDHPLFRQGILNALNTCDFNKTIVEVGSGKEALLATESQTFDVVLMDINMPVMDGIECSKRLIKKVPEIKIIALTSFEDKWTIEQMIEIGAKGYLLKNISKSELEISIQSVYNGKMFFSSDIVGKMLQRSSEFMSKMNSISFDELHEREKSILKLIFEEYNSVEIAEKLNLSEHTINTYRKSLMAKTGAKNVVGLIKYAFKNGWF